MTAYQSFSPLYEQFMEDAPYDEWMTWLCATFPDLHRWSVADIGCGTGTLTRLLAEKCRRIVGVDLSADMLGVAMAETLRSRVRIDWLCQDMTDLQLPFSCELVVSTCDAVNYLRTKDDVARMLARVYQQLLPGGWFCFDLIGGARLEQLRDGLSYDIRDDAAALFESSVSRDGTITYELTAFIVRPDGLYQRVSEVHTQQWYPLEETAELLQAAGFDVVETVGDFSSSVAQAAQRLLIRAQRR